MRHLWLRAIALGAAVIVAALLLKLAHPLVVLALFVAGFIVFSLRLRRAVRPAPVASTEAGLQRADIDPFGILGYPLLLLSRVGEPAIDEVVWGRWRGVDVHAFDLSFDPPAVPEPSPGRTVFSCAMARIDPAAPAVVVEPQMFATSLGAGPDLERLDVGDAPFQGVMNVWAEDAGFARSLLGPPTREWLRTAEPRWGLEVRGKVALVYGPKPVDPDVAPVLEVLRGLLARLPTDEGVSHPPAV